MPFILSGSISILPGCSNFSQDSKSGLSITENRYETILGELSEETGYTFDEFKEIGKVSLDVFNTADYSEEDIKNFYRKVIKNHENNDKNENLRQKSYPITENISELEGTEKVFEPYTHILVKTFYIKNDDTKIEYIEGYKLIDIEYNERAPIKDFRAFYVNEVEVIAKATEYNEETNQYFYQNFGTVTNKESEKTLSR